MWRVMQVLAWRSSQPALLRWLEASALFGIALAVRFWLGPLHGSIPFLTFYPAILLAAVALGWKEATFVLVLSLSAGWYFFFPPGLLLLTAGYAFVGALNIAIIIALKTLAQKLAEANESQRVLFQELQHRVANTLQSAVGKLGTVRRRMESNPTEATNMLDEAIERMTISADIHRRLNDLSLFSRGLEPMLRDVVATVIDDPSVTVSLKVDELDVTLDQASVIAMLVIETANNSSKHVFRRNIGSRFDVALLALPGSRALLRIKDDGLAAVDTIADTTSPARGLGMHVLQGLVAHMRGTLSIRHDEGTEIAIEFPVARSYV